MIEWVFLLHCTLVGGIFISGLGDIVLTGGWVDGWSRGCLETTVDFIFTPFLVPLPTTPQARKGVEGERAAKEKAKKVEKAE